ncbi:4-(cytidine 5'-diphospho)-2-C-methyl-D-erythritol kinase [Chloroflexota bacterium]
MLTVRAPAKLNLTLEVLAKRGDGFHEVCGVVQTIDLCDSLRFQAGPDIEFKCDMPGWVLGKSLVSQATRLLQEVSGCDRGAKVEISKRIPLVAGLGGDSSDAAAVLRGLNKLWGLRLSLKELLKIGLRLGSDVTFFLYGGIALASGRGERITPLPPLPRRWVVMVIPDVPRLPGKTGQSYAKLKASHYTDGQITERLVGEMREGGKVSPSLLFNTFENIAFSGWSKSSVYREHMLKMGAGHVHLAGSGPTLFTLWDDKVQAEDFYVRCQQQKLETYLARTA